METYKITKAVRFKLEADEKAIPAIMRDVSALKKMGENVDINGFVGELRELLGDINDYLYREDDFKSGLTVKNTWLRDNAKDEIAGQTLKRGLTIRDIKGKDSRGNSLQENIEKVFVEVIDIYEGLKSAIDSPLHKLSKRASIGLLLKGLTRKRALPYLISFLDSSDDKDEKSSVSLIAKKRAKVVMDQLECCIRHFLPAQSHGLQVAKASFNYYTVNKKEIDYKGTIEESKKDLKVDRLKESLNRIFDNMKVSISKEVKTELLNDISSRLSNSQDLFLGYAPAAGIEKGNYLRQILKNIKSEQKAAFNEFMTQNPSFDDLKGKKLYLFEDISVGEFNAYKKLTVDIGDKATKINQAKNDSDKQRLRSELNKRKKERGDLINAANRKNGNENNFKTYKAFAEVYRKIAQRHGKILAQLKGIEREKIEYDMLKYWALIIGLNGRHKLVLIPEKRAKECKEWLEASDESSRKDGSVCWFESFTLRSLKKLCFGNLDSGSNTFNSTIISLLPKDRKGEAMNGDYAFAKSVMDERADAARERKGTEPDSDTLKEIEQKKINFYKDVLKVQKTLNNLPEEEIKMKIINRNFDNLDEFQVALEKICYRVFYSLSAEAEQTLKSKYDAQIFEITSIDLKNPENVKDKQEKYAHTDKRHTQIWNDFWTNDNEKSGFDIRLNPEITITYREPKQSRVNKYGKESGNYDVDKKNRYLYPQFTLTTTVSEHSNSPTKQLAFVTDDEFKKSVDEFNKKFKKEDIKFAFGIDNGEIELSTLGVYFPVFSKGANEEKIAEMKQIEKHGFKVLTIKDLNYKETDYNGKERKIIQNPSYFLKKENYMRTFKKSEEEYKKMFAEVFKERCILTLDLTTAKVIHGYIVTNGDVPAFFGLWMRHAQRTIFEMNPHGKHKTAQKTKIKSKLDTDKEKLKFAEHISNVKLFRKLTDEEKARYIKWIFEERESGKFTEKEDKTFRSVCKKKGDYRSGIVFASSYIGEELKSETEIFDCRHIFKKHEAFYSISSEKEILEELDRYNTDRTSHDIPNERTRRNISNEELDLQITDVKRALVANVIGVIDLLYKQYKQRCGGEGLVVKEAFDTKMVEEGIEKFSGNIYRILERKLYQKFQNYGLVPPIKSLLTVRGEKEELRLGNVSFVKEEGTSQRCPICEAKSDKKHTDHLKCNCGFDSDGVMHRNDGIAGFNIAKRGFENFMKEDCK
jgi:hypothetical protein